MSVTRAIEEDSVSVIAIGQTIAMCVGTQRIGARSVLRIS